MTRSKAKAPEVVEPTVSLPESVGVAARFTESNPTTPLAPLFYLGADNTIRASTGTVGVQWPAPLSLSTPVAVEGAQFAKLIQSYALSSRAITLSLSSGKLVVKCAGSRVSLPAITATDDLLAFMQRTPPKERTATPPEFWDHVSSALEFAAKSDEDSAFRGVYVFPGGDLAASDRERIVVYHPSKEHRITLSHPLFLPAHMLERVDRAVLRTVTHLGVHDEALWLFFASSTMTMWGALLKAEFPAAKIAEFVKHARTARGKSHCDLTTHTSDVLAALDRIVMLTSAPFATVFQFEGDRLAVSSESRQADAVHVAERISAKCAGEGKAYVNAKLMRDVLPFASVVHTGAAGPGGGMLYCVPNTTPPVVEVLVALLAPPPETVP